MGRLDISPFSSTSAASSSTSTGTFRRRFRGPRPISAGNGEHDVSLLLLFLLYAVALSVALARAGHRSLHVAPGGVAPRRPTRLLIVGATGGTGRQLVLQALERGLTVTALVRDPSRLQISHPQLTVARGDVLDEGSVHAAMRGQEAVLSALGHKRFFSPTRTLSEGTRNILRAME